MDVSKLRDDFPILSQTVKGKPIVYFDNACMSLRPSVVIEAVTKYYTKLSACAGRSNHRLAKGVSEAVDVARIQVQKFIGAKYKEEVIFTRNTSEGLNLVANSLGFDTGDVVVTSDKEHNSNLVPWLKMVQQTKGIKHLVMRSKTDNTFDMPTLEAILAENKVKLVSVVQTSNLDGVTFPIEEITKLVHRHGALVMVDAAQSAPHLPTDVSKSDVDFLAFSGHKLCGPSGMGGLYGKKKLLEKMEGFLVGGDTVDYTTYTDYKLLPIPEKFEAGLQDYAGIMGLGAAVDYVGKVGWQAMHEHEVALNRIITEGLHGEKRLHIIGPKAPELRGGVFSFYVDGVDAHQIALLLDESYGVMVRSGQHCVHSWFDAHEIKGSVRASLYFYNTEEEAERFVSAVKAILEIL